MFKKVKRNRGGQKAAYDGATGCSVKAFQFCNIGDAEKRKRFR